MNPKADYLAEIGKLVTEARTRQDMTQAELAQKVGTSQSAINRIERGKQNASLEIIRKISRALQTPIVSLGDQGDQGYRIKGGKTLHGSVRINTSKNASVG
ncbi:helix-turn-helix domain-containing protein, partial [Candidatus Saccharibacteria bacterium]|nr:helix-turn-helix domain-containing protein [Candidatus Saccharibacteria bacterium]